MKISINLLLQQMTITWDELMTAIEAEYMDIFWCGPNFTPDTRDAIVCDMHKDINNWLDEMMIIKEAFNALLESENIKNYDPIEYTREDIDAFAQQVAHNRIDEMERDLHRQDN